jgi:hypothetical protein
MKYSYILFFFFLSAAHAQECPSISGTFNCQSGTEPYNIQVQTQEGGYGAARHIYQCCGHPWSIRKQNISL